MEAAAQSFNMGTVKKTDNNGSLSPGLRPSDSVTLLTAAEMLLPMRELVVTGTDYYCRVPCVYPMTDS